LKAVFWPSGASSFRIKEVIQTTAGSQLAMKLGRTPRPRRASTKSVKMLHPTQSSSFAVFSLLIRVLQETLRKREDNKIKLFSGLDSRPNIPFIY
jgi:hypothetical protein